MKTEKQRTHLTPKEVQEFIDLGVDFGETVDIWVKIGKQWDRRSREFQSELDDVRPDIEAGLGFELPKSEVLPAPNLQEATESLPSIKTMADEENFTLNGRNYLHVFYPSLIRRMDGYLVTYENGYVDEEPLYESEFHDNLLNAVIEALKWVCKNHPETLTKTE